MKHLLAALLAITFALAFDDGQPSFQFSFWLLNFFRMFLIVTFSILAKELVRKYVASRYSCSTEFRVWSIERFGLGRHTKLPANILGYKITSIPLGVILPVLIAFISLGKLPFIAAGVFVISTHLAHRTGKRYLNISEFEEAKIALAAPLTSLGIAFLFKFLSPANSGLEEVVTINAMLAVFHMLPFPDLDGAKVFFAGKTFYVFNFIFILAAALMISIFSVTTSVILAIIFAFIVAANYHYFLRYK